MATKQLQTKKIGCSQCSSRAQCWPSNLDEATADEIERLVAVRVSVKRGESAVIQGSPFKNLLAIRAGSFKSSTVADDGHVRMTGFHLSGQTMGLDALATGSHKIGFHALEDSEICVIPFDRFEMVALSSPGLQRKLHQRMAAEILREHEHLVLVGSGRAEMQIAKVLLNLLECQAERGYSVNEIVLRMSRDELASYLCIKPETVSRTFTKLVDIGMLEVKQRNIRILDMQGLQHLTDSQATRGSLLKIAAKRTAPLKPAAVSTTSWNWPPTANPTRSTARQ